MMQLVLISALSLSDVNVAFQQSAHKVLLDDDNLLPLLHLTIEYHGKEHKGISTCIFGNALRGAMMALFSSPITYPSLKLKK